MPERLTCRLMRGAIIAVGVVLCATASAYQEAPILAERVAADELPPVEDRLPENPLVVEPVEEIGTYGGTWRRLSMGGRDLMLTSRMGYEPLVRWDRTGKQIVPGLAESWEVSDEGKTYTFHLRKGLRWSDGAPLTSEDYAFTFDDFYSSKDLCPVWPSWLKTAGEPAAFNAPDAHTLEFRFSTPYSIFLEILAFYSTTMAMPKHYMSQFHAAYRDEEELLEQARERGFDHWSKLFHLKANQNENPECPSHRPFVLSVPPPAPRMVAVRNPYYWKVDPEGNQLPYIDEIAFRDVQNSEVVTMKAMSGEVDFQARRIDATSYPLFMEGRKKGEFRVIRDAQPGTVVLYLNQCSKDPVMKEILTNRDFRIALSLAINREELIFLLFSNMAVPSRGVASPYDPYYLPEYDRDYLGYDPVRANELLDRVGLPRGPNGMRTLPDGSPFRQMLNVFPSESGTSSELWQLVSEYFREVGLDFVVKQDAVTLSRLQVCNGNSDFWAYSTSGLHWVSDPVWYVPWRSSSYFCPLYGRYVASNGKDTMGVQPPPSFQRLVDWYNALCSVHGPDAEQQKTMYARKILGQWAEECYTIGICRQDLLTIVKNNFRNVPESIIHDYRIMAPGYIGIEQFYMEGADSRPKDGEE
ncbi:MAG: ABC transporter substrate-binding protein [bacterium]|nr:ABC transporter substrate-binding protein [bacterium]